MTDIDNEPNLAQSFSQLINAADDHMRDVANDLDAKQDSYTDGINAMTSLLRLFESQRGRFDKEDTISLLEHPEIAAIIKRLQEEIIPMLAKNGLVNEDSAPLREGTDLSSIDGNTLAHIEDDIDALRSIVKNARSHLPNEGLQKAQNHSMSTAVLSHLNPHRVSDTMIEHQKPRL